MSLQGSLDTFALPDVLLLLAGTKKSGELDVAGHRVMGSSRPPDLQGRVWFENGHLVGSDVARATDSVEAMFELLRLVEGTFSFVTGSAPLPHPPEEIEPLLNEAQSRLTEWREIEKVVPSLTAWLDLAAEPPAAHVAMRGDQWRMVAAVGGGCEVDTALARLSLGELPGCRAVKELIEAGLVNLTRTTEREPALSPPAAPFSTPSFVTVEPPPTIDDALPAEDGAEDGAGAGAAEPVGPTDWRSASNGVWALERNTSEPPWERSVPRSADLVTDPPDAADRHDIVDVDVDAAHASRAALSDATLTVDEPGPGRSGLRKRPQPQEEPAPLATSVERPMPVAAPEAAVAPGALDGDDTVATDVGEEGDEPLNRGLLLKFLSSVRT